MNDIGISSDNDVIGSDSSSFDTDLDINDAAAVDLDSSTSDDLDEELTVEDVLDDEQQASTTEGATVVDAAAIYQPICYKLDLIIMLLVVIFAAFMLKGLANSYKLGGRHIGKSS